MVDRADVIWAYRLFLAREPDEQFLDDMGRRNVNRQQLRDQFVQSVEFGSYLSTRGFTCAQIIGFADRFGKPFWVSNSFLPCLADLVSGNYQYRVASWLQDTLRSGDTFVDIGAGTGWLSIVASQHVGEAGKVYAFEPHEPTFGAMKRTVEARNATISCIRLALGSRNDFACLAAPLVPDGRGARIASPAPGLERVPTNALDSLTIDHRISVIKIDTNGSETDVFIGARQTIKTHRPHLIIPRQMVQPLTPALTDLGYLGVEQAPGDDNDLVILDPH
jgi:FkbM family methyltransferase